MTQALSTQLLDLFTTFGYLGIVVAMTIESGGIPLPSELIMPLAGFLAYQGKMGLVQASVAGAVGCVIGSAIAYWIGATGGRPLLLKYGRYVLISHRDAARADEFFQRYGNITAFLSRLMPIVRTFISFPAGIARMRFDTFLLYTFLGSLPWTFALAFAGYKLGQNWERVGGALREYDLVVVLAVVALLAWFIYRHLQPDARHEREEDEREESAV